MKSKYLVLSAVSIALLAAGCNKNASETTSQTTSLQNTSSQDTMMHDNAMIDKTKVTAVFMKDGKEYAVMQDKSVVLITQNLNLPIGVQISSNGSITNKDGSKTTLQNGQELELDGSVMTATPDMLMMVNSTSTMMHATTTDSMMASTTNDHMMQGSATSTMMHDNTIIKK